MKNRPAPEERSASELISKRINELDDWRGETLGRVRTLIEEADPEIVEEWKWRGVPVWSHRRDRHHWRTYKNVVKLTFAKGAFLKDPDRLFNASLDGNLRARSDISEGEKIKEERAEEPDPSGGRVESREQEETLAGARCASRPSSRSSISAKGLRGLRSGDEPLHAELVLERAEVSAQNASA